MKKCECSCGKLAEYNEMYDAYYCSDCIEWLEKDCDDPRCDFCRDRPEKPVIPYVIASYNKKSL